MLNESAISKYATQIGHVMFEVTHNAVQQLSILIHVSRLDHVVFGVAYNAKQRVSDLKICRPIWTRDLRSHL